MRLVDASAWVEIPVNCRDAHFEAIRQILGNRLQVEPV